MGCNFCPFAAKTVLENTVRYEVFISTQIKPCLEKLISEFIFLDNNDTTETGFIILPAGFADFYIYLNLINKAESLLKKAGYEGIYQIASFHPLYTFEGAPTDDPANYTNRSPYPMLQILREHSITQALERYPHPENIPENNIKFARKKGLVYMKQLRDDCFNL